MQSFTPTPESIPPKGVTYDLTTAIPPTKTPVHLHPLVRREYHEHLCSDANLYSLESSVLRTACSAGISHQARDIASGREGASFLYLFSLVRSLSSSHVLRTHGYAIGLNAFKIWHTH